MSTLSPFSKILVLTEGMINQALLDLYGLHAKLGIFEWQHETATISIDLRAPKIRIVDGNQLVLLIRFAEGNITLLPQKEAVNVKDWTFAYPFEWAKLSALSSAANDMSLENMLNLLISIMDDSNGPDLSVSQCQDMSLNAWYEANPLLKDRFRGVVKTWPQSLKARGYNTLGLKINPPEIQPSKPLEAILKIGATQPDQARTVSYLLYRTSGDNQIPESAHAFNSILVCSKSSDVTSSFNATRFRGNFLKEAMSPAAQSVTSGLWTLNYQDLLEQLILPNLNVLNEATEMVVSSPERSSWGTSDASYEPTYFIKRNFAAADDDGRLDSTYQFSKTSTGYEWKLDPAPVNEEYPADNYCLKTKFETSTSHKSTVSWAPGTSILKLDYVTVYRFNTKRYDAKDELIAQLNCSPEIHWQIEVILAIEDGVFTARVQPIDPKTLIKTISPGFESQGLSMSEGLFPLRLQSYIENKMEPSIITAVGKIKEKFEQTITLRCPESRVFTFQNFILNVDGDFISGIKYKINPTRNLLQAAPLLERQPELEPEKPKPLRPASTLRWSWQITQDKPTELAIIGTQDAEAPALGRLELLFLCGASKVIPNISFKPGTRPNGETSNAGYISVSNPEVAKIQVDSDDNEKWKVVIRPMDDFLLLGEDESITIVLDSGVPFKAGKDDINIMETQKDPHDQSTLPIKGIGSIDFVCA